MDTVTIPFGDDPSERATLLLAAAEDLEMSQRVVRTTSSQEFVVPKEVADKAGLGDDGEGEEPKKPAKKAAAKKTAKE